MNPEPAGYWTISSINGAANDRLPAITAFGRTSSTSSEATVVIQPLRGLSS
ncbi:MULTISPECIES: hypothetical protein [Burkholderia]|uniref:hypothetical protein n=1 Tax=Burkholderia TaxID=32008 RepID=UPI001364DB98|nr:hypothetical protein [Burkholderia cenocepacia]